MGGGNYSDDTYRSSKADRTSRGVSDFAYSETAKAVHANLDPKRILHKPFKKLESRDSAEHPNSNAVFVSFDVTGSNYERAVDAQKKLTNLMELLRKYIDDPQVLIAANDDIGFVGENAIQISDFESDNRIDEHIRNVWLTGAGGGNSGESYDLIMYGAAYLTVLDCMEKRDRKGYFFMYADEPIFSQVRGTHVQRIFGINTERNIPIDKVVADLKKLYHVFVIWPEGGYAEALDQYVKLFGRGCVLTLQHPNMICELIGSAIGLNEAKVTPEALVTDLVHVSGMSTDGARGFTKALLANRAHA